MEQGLMWVIVYCAGVIIHMIVSSLLTDKEFKGSKDEAMLWIMCFIPLTWVFYWIAGCFYIHGRIQDGRHKRKN